jgi:hypothetical protein
MNKKTVIAAILMAATTGTLGTRAFARVNVDINIGQPAPIIVAPPPPPRHRIFVERRPRFMFTPPLGFYVSVDGPYDMVYYGDRYYVYDDGRWFGARSYEGPWVFIEDHRLPGRLRRYRHEDIRRYRDEEFSRHGHDRDRHDNGRGHDRERWR